ncbi:MAG: RHS repeat-associated core domain-containing protein, partial [Anaerolineae bacterium]
TSTLTYLHGDHLGSASLSTNASGGKVSEMRYYPYGEMRSGAMATDRQYTGQRREIGLGLYDYNARYYDPYPNRFIQADSIVPGAASGSGGGAATLGYDSNTRLTPLTVNLGEFAAQVNAENREVLQFGAFFQWDSKTRQEHNVPMGPANPQALNRYAYCLNNPLRYVDPTGHQVFNILDSVWKAGIALLELKITNINRNLWKWELGAAIVFGAAGGSLGLLCGPGAYVCAAGIGALSAGAGFLVGRSLGEATVAEELDVAIKYIAWAAIPEADSYEVDFQWVHTSPLSINPSLRIEVKGLKPIYISRKAGLELLKNLWISADEVETASE